MRYDSSTCSKSMHHPDIMDHHSFLKHNTLPSPYDDDTDDDDDDSDEGEKSSCLDLTPSLHKPLQNPIAKLLRGEGFCGHRNRRRHSKPRRRPSIGSVDTSEVAADIAEDFFYRKCYDISGSSGTNNENRFRTNDRSIVTTSSSDTITEDASPQSAITLPHLPGKSPKKPMIQSKRKQCSTTDENGISHEPSTTTTTGLISKEKMKRMIETAWIIVLLLALAWNISCRLGFPVGWSLSSSGPIQRDDASYAAHLFKRVGDERRMDFEEIDPVSELDFGMGEVSEMEATDTASETDPYAIAEKGSSTRSIANHDSANFAGRERSPINFMRAMNQHRNCASDYRCDAEKSFDATPTENELRMTPVESSREQKSEEQEPANKNVEEPAISSISTKTSDTSYPNEETTKRREIVIMGGVRISIKLANDVGEQSNDRKGSWWQVLRNQFTVQKSDA